MENTDKKIYYLKTYFDKIDFDKLPDSFVIKCNHGCKWHYIIKNKNLFLKNKRLFNIVRRQITGWLEQEFWGWNSFEMQYKDIKPLLLIEPLLRDDIDIPCNEIQFFCFNGKIELVIRIDCKNNKTCLYDKKLNIIDDTLSVGDDKAVIPVDEIIKRANTLSELLAKDFCFVRVDWMIYKNKLYFEELTFTPNSGFNTGIKQKFNIKLGELINELSVCRKFI